MSEQNKYAPLTKETWEKFIKEQLTVIPQRPQPTFRFYSKEQADIFNKTIQEIFERDKIRLGSQINTK